MGIDKAYYAMLKSHHLCTRCKTQDAYTLAGRAVCADCAEKMAEKARERRKTSVNGKSATQTFLYVS